jgi:hypothetical protein
VRSSALLCLSRVRRAADACSTGSPSAIPGNRPTTEAQGGIPAGFGSVGYAYRMTRTEITVIQHFEFVQAARPFYDFGSISADNATVRPRHRHPRRHRHPFIVPLGTTPRRPCPLQYAARYCNWLHNGMVNEAWAFESGAYDTSPSGRPARRQRVHHDSSARRALATGSPTSTSGSRRCTTTPTNGEDGGYWRYSNRSDESAGQPRRSRASRRESSGGNWINDFGPSTGPVDVGSYPDMTAELLRHAGLGPGACIEWTGDHRGRGPPVRRGSFSSYRCVLGQL